MSSGGKAGGFGWGAAVLALLLREAALCAPSPLQPLHPAQPPQAGSQFLLHLPLTSLLPTYTPVANRSRSTFLGRLKPVSSRVSLLLPAASALFNEGMGGHAISAGAAAARAVLQKGLTSVQVGGQLLFGHKRVAEPAALEVCCAGGPKAHPCAMCAPPPCAAAGPDVPAVLAADVCLCRQQPAPGGAALQQAHQHAVQCAPGCLAAWLPCTRNGPHPTAAQSRSPPYQLDPLHRPSCRSNTCCCPPSPNCWHAFVASATNGTARCVAALTGAAPASVPQARRRAGQRHGAGPGRRCAAWEHRDLR